MSGSDGQWSGDDVERSGGPSGATRADEVRAGDAGGRDLGAAEHSAAPPAPPSQDPATLRFSGIGDLDVQHERDVNLSTEDHATINALRPGTALLLVLRGPNAGARFLLDSPLTTSGRHPDSDIFLDDVTVSRKHAVFQQDGDGFAVSDVGSLNGTYVNRVRIDSARLQQGDEVQIGKFRLVFYNAKPTGS